MVISLCLAVGFFLPVPPARAATVISGDITKDTVWTSAGNPYLVESDVFILDNATLLIMEGVEVYFNGPYYLSAKRGDLIVNGTPDSPVLFTYNQSSPWGGIQSLYEGGHVEIRHAVVQYASTGLYLESDFNLVSNSTFTSFNYSGIRISGSMNEVYHNLISDAQTGIEIYGWTGMGGYGTIVEGNTITENMYGIEVYYSYGMRIFNNTITGNQYGGINIFSGTDIEVVGNIISYTGVSQPISQGDGITLGDSTESSLVACNLVENNFGTGISVISFYMPNFVYYNNIINNSRQAYDSGNATYWDDSRWGNYWSDYNETDTDGDGVGDVPYFIDTDNEDRFPMMAPWGYCPVWNLTNRPPVAIAEPAQQQIWVGDAASFDASSSYDPDGYIVNYSWSFGDGAVGFGVAVSHRYTSPGTFNVTLLVTDNEGATDTCVVQVIVHDLWVNRPPVADAGDDITADEGSSVVVNGNGSYDPDGWITKYEWDFNAEVDSDGDGDPANDVDATGMQPSYVYGDNGDYTVILTVTDNENATGSDTLFIHVRNVPPTGTIAGPASGKEGDLLLFSAKAWDQGSDDLSIVIDWGDGSTAFGCMAYNDGIAPDPYPSPWGRFPFSATCNGSHIYGDDGTYEVVLTVRDDDGGVSTTRTTVLIENVPPTAQILEAYVDAKLGLRVAGTKWNKIVMELLKDGMSWKNVSIERMPGSPNDRMVWLDVRFDMASSYEAIITYYPLKKGSNPTWLILKLPDDKEIKMHHNFNYEQSVVRDSEHPVHAEPWIVDLNANFVDVDVTFVGYGFDHGTDDLIFTWDWGDGTTTVNVYYNNGVGPDPYPSPLGTRPFEVVDMTTHRFAVNRTYSVKLTVSDDDGGESSDILTVDLSGTPYAPGTSQKSPILPYIIAGAAAGAASGGAIGIMVRRRRNQKTKG